jgi:hypothetical protein
MLAVAISLEIVAFSAMFGFGGLALGASLFGLALLLLAGTVAHERRQARRLDSHRVWTYFALNDRLSARASARRRVPPEPYRIAAARFTYFNRIHNGRGPVAGD